MNYRGPSAAMNDHSVLSGDHKDSQCNVCFHFLLHKHAREIYSDRNYHQQWRLKSQKDSGCHNATTS